MLGILSLRVRLHQWTRGRFRRPKASDVKDSHTDREANSAHGQNLKAGHRAALAAIRQRALLCFHEENGKLRV